jgi:hypothetical protein
MKKTILITLIGIIIILTALAWYFKNLDIQTPRGEAVIRAFVDSEVQLIKTAVESRGELINPLTDEGDVIEVAEEIIKGLFNGENYSVEVEKNKSDAYYEYCIIGIIDENLLAKVFISGEPEEGSISGDITVELIKSGMFEEIEDSVFEIENLLKPLVRRIYTDISLTGAYDGKLVEKQDIFSDTHIDSEKVDIRYNEQENKTYVTVHVVR